MSLKSIPIVIRLHSHQIESADAMKDLAIDKHRIDKALLKQPATYAWYAALYSEAEAKSAELHERQERMESKLFREYMRKVGKSRRVSDVKHAIMKDKDYLRLRDRVLLWDNSARVLKHIVRAFDQRLSVLQSYSANQRRDWRAEDEINSKKHHRER